MIVDTRALKWDGHELLLLDQRKLPFEENYISVKTIEGCHDAIKDMVVRGAPLIGFSAIFGLALHAKNCQADIKKFETGADYLKNARPTAVNLAYEVERCMFFAKRDGMSGLAQLLSDFGKSELEKLGRDNLKMAELALADVQTRVRSKSRFRFMTLCNTGFLACGPLGTALGVISTAHKKGLLEHVYASETRPYLQGSRLTAYELVSEGIAHEITVEGAASYLLGSSLVDAIFVGADRIAANGDTANKVGTSSLAIIAKYYQIPFYVIAPSSSFDLSTPSGNEIEIEMRPESEILKFRDMQIAPFESKALNPSFDVTRAENITGIICEKGFINPALTGEVERVIRS